MTKFAGYTWPQSPAGFTGYTPAALAGIAERIAAAAGKHLLGWRVLMREGVGGRLEVLVHNEDGTFTTLHEELV